ncbi:MAG: serpin family protein [Candidatus Latescibacteria bacterium]|nr:serpin family protein [Candidatus Latescibacterota bacterium]NIM64442.1 serpin family protein [Candidatus Latescibacterota bacterium]NIO00596.1 serpin family protein [Candidatus Latescibacterota bacterium]NIO26996.1 serpin family protein [Candidatus Latescibacterota bacterium]NIO56073.1 serpin family protein [Candidatus Latescibacterota bacterium]
MSSLSSISRFLICFAVLVLIGCSENPVKCPKNDGQPPATPPTLELRIGRTNDFAFDLYHHLSSSEENSEENLIVSPHSIVTTFGMAYAGARGTTEREIANVLHFNYPPLGFHSVLKKLNDILESRGSTVGPESFRLSIANSAWGSARFTFLPSYLDTISLNYGAELQYLDFLGQPELSRLVINQWASDQTHGLIKDLIPQGKITPAIILVLANTIYFRASWLHQFDPDHTRYGAFTRLDGSEVNVPVMSGETVFPYHNGDGYAAIGLPYKGEECTMVMILPDEGEFESVESSLSPAKLDTIIDEFRTSDVIVYLPKFSFETKYELKPALKEMGIYTAFYPGANFSGLDGTDDGIPWISFVAHKTFISVDEYGTMAASGTGMGFSVGIPPVFDAVRPFIFVIRDDETGTILFLGRVLDPSLDPSA